MKTSAKIFSLLLLITTVYSVNVAFSQDVEELTRSTRELTDRTIQLERQIQSSETHVRDLSTRLQSAERERAEMNREIGNLARRIDELMGIVESTAAEPQVRGFEPSGNGWRFDADGSIIEIGNSGIKLIANSIEIESQTDLAIKGASRLRLEGGIEANVYGGGNRVRIDPSQIRLYSQIICLGTCTRPVARIADQVGLQSSGENLIISGSSSVFAGD